MSATRFATICDKCGKRSPEYSRFPYCVDCGADICPDCTVDISYQNNPDRLAVICPGCAEVAQ